MCVRSLSLSLLAAWTFVPMAHAEPPVALSPNGKAAAALLDLAFNQKQVAAAFRQYVGPTYRQHNPTVPDGKEQAVRTLSEGVKTMNVHYDIKRIIADGDLVAVHSRVTLGPEDRGMAVVDIFRFENGKIVEHWDVVQQVPEHAANINGMF
jgi:predicted SnoaL-like aldol condensation-catalyzing enzyme